MPTGGGKSICFQVPALAKDGLCLVVSPLIALMKDQVENLKAKGIPASAVVSGMSRSEIDAAFDNCIYGKIKFLYISPERLTSDVFLSRITQMNVNLIAIDEAHCISQWGYDFRPSYLKIADIRSHLPGIPVLALTATATPDVQQDIMKKLNFQNGQLFKKSFERKNLSYVVLYEEDKLNRLLKVAQNIEGTGIVYVRTRRKAKEISDFLVKQGFKSAFYHAGLDSQTRSKIQDDWMKGRSRVVVSTNAFGMGIDKSNVRFVVHLEPPDSPEAYYQEAGRAGRDEQKSYAVLLFNESDVREMEHRAEISFPDISTIRTVYQALCNFYQLPVGSGKGVSFNFDIALFCTTYNLQVAESFNALKVLELQGLIATSESADLHSRIRFTANHQHLYEFQVKNPGLDQLIKVILRSYEGVFDDYIVVHEKEIALRAGISKEECIQYLQQLQQLKILQYIPASDSPQLTFTEERVDLKYLRIDREHLAERKSRYLKRIKAMVQYASSKNLCRSQLLLAYFGEESQHRCGVCDVCLQRNKIGLSDLEFENIHSEIKDFLLKGNIQLHELLKSMKVNKEEENLKVIEWMIDNHKIRYGKGNSLEWIEE